MADLKLVYKANTKEFAEEKLLDLDEKWGKKYPAVLKSWNNNWDNLSAYFKYPDEIRRLIILPMLLKDFIGKLEKLPKPKALFLLSSLLRNCFIWRSKILRKNGICQFRIGA